MGEPAIQPDPDNYPEEDESPDLESVEGGGESTPRESGHLQGLPSRIPDDSAEPGTDPAGIHGVKGGGESTPRSKDHLSDASSLTPAQIKQREKAALPGNKGALPGAEKGLVKGGLGSLTKGPSKGIIGLASKMFGNARTRNSGLIGGGMIGLIVILITTFSPILRLEHLFQNIDNRAFAAAGDAVEHRMEHLFERYMLLKITNINSCTAVVSSDCRAHYAGKGIATNLFNAWRDARVEEKIFPKMGFSVESTRNPDRKAGVHRFTLRDSNGKTLTIANEADFDRFVEGEFKGGRREFGREMRKALRDTTLSLNIMQRKAVRKYLKRKHDVKIWCFLSCKKKDAAEDKIKDGKTRFKYKFVQRFVYPLSAKYGLILDCIVSGGVNNKSKCGPERLEEVGVDPDKVSDEDRDRILKDFEDNPNLKLSQAVLKSLLVKIMSEQAAKAAVSAIPIAGQAYFGLVVIDSFDKLDSFIKDYGLSNYAADLNRSQYIQYYTAMRSDGDALKRGKLSLEDTGILVDEFNGAEKSRVWQAYNGKKVNKNDHDYKCSDGNPIPDDQLVCREKKIKRTYKIEDWRNDSVVNGIINTLNTYGRCIGAEIAGHCAGTRPRTVIRPVIESINWAAGTIIGAGLDLIIKGVEATPVIGEKFKELREFAESKFQELLQAILGKVFPLPVNVDSPPRDKYDALEAGGDIEASEFAMGGYTDDGDSYGQGAPKASKETLTAIYQDYYEQQEYEFKTSSFTNRIANVHEPNSLVSKMAASIPSGFSSMFFSIVTAPANLFKNLAAMPDVLFSSSANAQSAQSLAERQASHNPFGVTRHAWALDDPAIKADPDKYTPEYCQKIQQERIAGASRNKVTGFEEFSGGDPCLLERVVTDAGCTLVVEGSGCLEEDSVITPPGGGATIVTGTAKQLAKKLLGYLNEGKYKCDGNPEDCNDIKLMARGESISCAVHDCPVYDACRVNHLDKKVMQLLIYLIDSGYSIGTSALCRSHSLTTGVHHLGRAVDIASINGKSLCDWCGSGAKSLALEVDRIIFNLNGKLAADQLITYGVGGVHYSEFDKYNRSAPGVEGAGSFDSGTLNGHKNHIHVGY